MLVVFPQNQQNFFSKSLIGEISHKQGVITIQASPSPTCRRQASIRLMLADINQRWWRHEATAEVHKISMNGKNHRTMSHKIEIWWAELRQTSSFRFIIVKASTCKRLSGKLLQAASRSGTALNYSAHLMDLRAANWVNQSMWEIDFRRAVVTFPLSCHLLCHLLLFVA